jgi:hypothetical protein
MKKQRKTKEEKFHEEYLKCSGNLEELALQQEKRKKPKRWQCKSCPKLYVYMGWALRHSKKIGHHRFKDLKEHTLKTKEVR